MPTTKRVIILTGATGYIGKRLVEILLQEGRQVVVLSRAPKSGTATREIAWSLGDRLPAEALTQGVAPAEHAVIHLAHNWRDTSEDGEDERSNLAGTRALLDSAHSVGIERFVFVSSQSSRQDAANIYGRLKWRIEQLLQQPGDVAARVGLVYGGSKDAQYGLLSKLTKVAPVLPMIDPWREVQPIHLDEVCTGLLKLADGSQTGWVGLAGPRPVRFGVVLQTLARELHGKRLPIVPIPLRLALLACNISARIPVGPTIDRERVLGLAGTRNMECAAQLAELGLEVRSLENGLRGERENRRLLLAEGRTLLHYALGRPPSSALIRRYVRALDLTGPHSPLPISQLSKRLPALVRLGEPIGARSEAGRRLALATALVEADPASEHLATSSTTRRLTGLVGHVAVDVMIMPVRLVRHLLSRRA